MRIGDSVSPSLSRRRLLRTGGLAAAVLLGGAAMPLAGAPAAYADVPDSRRFKLDGTSGNPILRAPLHANWVMQSFGYDNTGQHVYFLQTETGSTNGDLWVTKTDTKGRELGAMMLRGFGHGVSIGVEPYGGRVYLWTEWKPSGTGYGTRLGRFAFVDGATLSADGSAVEDRTPSLPGTMIEPQPVIDPSTDRLLVRYKTATDRPRIVAFDLDDARAGRLGAKDRLVERALPSRGAWGADNPFQGFAAYGRYAYLLDGPVGATSYLTAVDLNGTGGSTVEDRVPNKDGSSLKGREPQGMAVWLDGGTPKLAFGFHSNTDGVRHASVFVKDQLV